MQKARLKPFLPNTVVSGFQVQTDAGSAVTAVTFDYSSYTRISV